MLSQEQCHLRGAVTSGSLAREVLQHRAEQVLRIDVETISLTGFLQEPVERIKIGLAGTKSNRHSFASSRADILPPGRHHGGQDIIFGWPEISDPSTTEV